MNATTTFLETQAEALRELLEKRDAYIIRLQDEISQKSSLVHTVRTEQNNFRNTVKELVIELVKDNDITHDVAEAFANACDFELTKSITINATVEFEIEVEVPFDVDPDDVVNSLEFSADAFDYSIDNFVLDVTNTSWEDTIS